MNNPVTLGQRVAALKTELIQLQRSLAADAPLPAAHVDTRADEIATVKARIAVLEEAQFNGGLANSRRVAAQKLRENLAGPERTARRFRT